jgi:hypothetical protein
LRSEWAGPQDVPFRLDEAGDAGLPGSTLHYHIEDLEALGVLENKALSELSRRMLKLAQIP